MSDADGEGVGSSTDRTVLVVLHDPLLSGATISVLRAVPLLEREGWRFVFWAPPGPAFDALLNQGATVHGEPRPIVFSLAASREPPGTLRRMRAWPGYLRRFREFVRELEPDLVHANTRFTAVEALASRRLGVPTLLHVHEMAPASWKARPARLLCRRAADFAVFVSKACADDYDAGNWAHAVVHAGVEIPEGRAAARTNPDPFVVGTVGVIAPRKGSDLFVEAARRVRGAGNAIEFRLVGAPSEPLVRAWASAVLASASAAGIRHCEQADVAAELRGWDAFVLPSRKDPCPLVMLEAMATGLPVIGSRSGGIPELVAPECGVLVEPEDDEALSEAIVRLAARPAAEREAMGAAGRGRVASKFSVARQAAGLADAYGSAIELARGS